jgi:hypothetical protein
MAKDQNINNDKRNALKSNRSQKQLELFLSFCWNNKQKHHKYNFIIAYPDSTCSIDLGSISDKIYFALWKLGDDFNIWQLLKTYFLDRINKIFRIDKLENLFILSTNLHELSLIFFRGNSWKFVDKNSY